MLLVKDFAKLLATIKEEKGLPEDVIISGLQAAMASAYRKSSPENQGKNVEAHIDNDGNLTIEEIFTVVEDGMIKSPDAEMTLEEVRAEGYNDLEIGDQIRTVVEVSPQKFGRIAAQTARQVIMQRLKDAERKILYEQFADKIGKVIIGTIFKAEGDQVLINLNEKTEAILPKDEKITGEKYVSGAKMKFYVLDVRQTTKGPRIIVSRSHPNLIRKLIEVEVPEIKDGTVVINNIIREPGVRAKIAVSTLDSNVEPLGACLGQKGTRIKAISSELNDERIDIVVFDSDMHNYIRNALTPAKIVKIEDVQGQERSVIAYVHTEELSLAIGKAGQNVRLAARLTGWKIDIKIVESEQLPTMKDLFIDFSK